LRVMVSGSGSGSISGSISGSGSGSSGQIQAHSGAAVPLLARARKFCPMHARAPVARAPSGVRAGMMHGASCLVPRGSWIVPRGSWIVPRGSCLVHDAWRIPCGGNLWGIRERLGGGHGKGRGGKGREGWRSPDHANEASMLTSPRRSERACTGGCQSTLGGGVDGGYGAMELWDYEGRSMGWPWGADPWGGTPGPIGGDAPSAQPHSDPRLQPQTPSSVVRPPTAPKHQRIS
jgi:hypothetical protein